MAQPKDFLHFLPDASGKSYRVNNGIVQAVSTPTPIPVGPDGWQEASIKYTRNLKAFGLFRSYTNPLKFVREGALILRDRLYKKFTEEKIYLVIHWLDKTFGGGWIHRFFYRGELDLAQTTDEDTHVEVNIMEGDLVKLMKANETTDYEIEINVPEAVAVKMDGHALKGGRSWLVPSAVLTGVTAALHFSPISYINGELADVGIIGATESPADPNSYFVLSGEDNQLFDWSGQIKIKVNSFVLLLQVRLIKRLADNSTVTLRTDTYNPPTPGLLYTFDYNYTDFELDAGEKLIISVVAGGNPATQDQRVVEYGESTFQASFSYRYRTTYIKGLRPLYVAQKLLDKITGGGYTVTSSYLSTVWENLLLTSGDAIRGFENAKLTISWSDFFDSYNVPCNLSWGIRNGQVFIERKSAVFQPTIQHHLGSGTDLVIQTAKEFQYSSLKIGYPNTDTEDVNGRDEFNVTQTYTSPVTRVNKAYELISKVSASMYEIELTRINLEGKTTTDDKNDTKAFFLLVEKTATPAEGDIPDHYKLLRETYTSITGLLSPETAFNIPLSPKRCLMAHGNFLRSVFYGNEGGSLVFQTSDKNADLVTVKDGVTIAEGGNVVIGTLDEPLFIPLEFKVKTPMGRDIIEKMDDGPDGTFDFTYDGATLYGFPMEVGIQPANKPAQETLLLCSPQTDLTKLITYGR